jgi:hypothetical protein
VLASQNKMMNLTPNVFSDVLEEYGASFFRVEEREVRLCRQVKPQSHWLILYQRGNEYINAASKSRKRL